MKKHIILLALIIVLSFILVGCGSDYSELSKTLSKQYSGNLFSVTNKYKDNTLTYIAARDNNNNFYRFTIDKDNRIIFADIYNDYVNDIKIKEKIGALLPEDYEVFVQYKINRTKECDIYLFTDYTIDLDQLTENLYNMEELSNCDITYHTATVANKDDLEQFKQIIYKELEKTGIFTPNVEETLKQYVGDYQTTVKRKAIIFE